MVKISGFMIGMVLVTMIITGLGLFTADLSGHYSADYDNSTFQSYNKLNELNTKAEEIQEETSSIEEKSGIVDIIGSYFSGAYKTLLLTKDSYDTFDSMTDDAVEQAHLGQMGNLIRTAIGTIVLILIFVAVILSAIMKWEL